MEAKCFFKAQRLDAITTLPEAILEAILCLLPLKEAARTSILSREWRYKWTKIPKVLFLKSTVEGFIEITNSKQISQSEIARRIVDKRSKLFHVILQILFLRQGPIHEFSFWVSEHHTFFDVDQIILHLARNHPVKKLTLDYNDTFAIDLPLSVFSLHHLTDLELLHCNINDKPIFIGFGNLTSLCICDVLMPTETLLNILSNCPSLKSLYLGLQEGYFPDHDKPNILELFKCLPLIEQLTPWDCALEAFVLDSVPQELPTSLIHLKYFYYEDMGFNNSHGFTFLSVLIKCSPNLEKIKLEINTAFINKLEENSFRLEEYSTVQLENLNELEIVNFRNFKPELAFVKFILAKSPNLKKVILLTYEVNKNEELGLLKDLSHAPHPSRVEIVVENHRND